MNGLQSILSQLGIAFAPLKAIKTNAQATLFFQKLGYEIPTSAFGSALTDLAANIEELSKSTQSLSVSTDNGVSLEIGNVLGRFVLVIDNIGKLLNEIKVNGGGALPNIDELP